MKSGKEKSIDDYISIEIWYRLFGVNDTIRMYKKGKIKMYKIVHDISP